MLQLETRIGIAATADRLWSILMDFPAYPRWNPFVRSIEGRAEVGATLSVLLQPPGGRPMRFRPQVRVVERPREFRWKGRLFIPGLFDGDHFFVIEEAAEGSVFHHGERFTGLLVPLLRRSLEGATRQGFIAMNEALKREAEH